MDLNFWCLGTRYWKEFWPCLRRCTGKLTELEFIEVVSAKDSILVLSRMVVKGTKQVL